VEQRSTEIDLAYLSAYDGALYMSSNNQTFNSI
jgi:hypothetical protein